MQTMPKLAKLNSTYRRKLRHIQKTALESGLNLEFLKRYEQICDFCEHSKETKSSKRKRRVIAGVLATFALILISINVVNSVLISRCLLPSNYLVWEATRPLADCSYCENINKPIILPNITRQDFTVRYLLNALKYIHTYLPNLPILIQLHFFFQFYAYSSRPIIVKKAAIHWKATKEFSYSMFKRLYEQTEGSYESLEDGCQFLNFKTDLFSLKEVFSMSNSRARNEPGEKPWYVGW